METCGCIHNIHNSQLALRHMQTHQVLCNVVQFLLAGGRWWAPEGEGHQEHLLAARLRQTPRQVQGQSVHSHFMLRCISSDKLSGSGEARERTNIP